MNKENLLKLAEFLELSVHREQFDMIHFRQYGRIPSSFISKNDCGTVGCALGWAPFVKGLETKDEDFFKGKYILSTLDFIAYCTRVFGLRSGDCEWDWCFSPEWVDIDNTPSGAARRIKELVNNGLPSNWEEQMLGETRIEY